MRFPANLCCQCVVICLQSLSLFQMYYDQESYGVNSLSGEAVFSQQNNSILVTRHLRNGATGLWNQIVSTTESGSWSPVTLGSFTVTRILVWDEENNIMLVDNSKYPFNVAETENNFRYFLARPAASPHLQQIGSVSDSHVSRVTWHHVDNCSHVITVSLSPDGKNW